MSKMFPHQKAVKHLIKSVHNHQNLDNTELSSLTIPELAQVIVRDMDDSELQKLTSVELKAISESLSSNVKVAQSKNKNYVVPKELEGVEEGPYMLYSLLIKHPDYSMFRLESAIIEKIMGLDVSQQKLLKNEIIAIKEEELKNNKINYDLEDDDTDSLEEQELFAKPFTPSITAIGIVTPKPLEDNKQVIEQAVDQPKTDTDSQEHESSNDTHEEIVEHEDAKDISTPMTEIPSFWKEESYQVVYDNHEDSILICRNIIKYFIHIYL